MAKGGAIRTELSGQRFGRWVVLKLSDRKLWKHHTAYMCRCDCGTERLVSGHSLRCGKSRSCGCAFEEAKARGNRKHGLNKHRLRGTWRSMKERCYNPKHAMYHRYGGRGIAVSTRWHDFANFVADNEHVAEPGLSLDRIDNDGPYSPDNCRWVTQKTQARNRSDSFWIEFNGKRMLAEDWAKELGLSRNAVKERLRSGWSVKDAVTVPKTPKHLLRAAGARSQKSAGL